MSAAFRYQVHHVGQERQPVLVVDQFLPQAERLVDYCASKLAFDRSDSFYPGLRMPAPPDYDKFIAYQLRHLIGDVFSTAIEKIRGARSVYSMVTTRPENLLPEQCMPHCDAYNEFNLACVHYLCGEQQGGTSLYRHISTGYESVNQARSSQYLAALDEDMRRYPVARGYINASSDIFARTVSYEAAFNRIVIYQGYVLHSGNIARDFSFDPNPRSGRLTLNTFFYF